MSAYSRRIVIAKGRNIYGELPNIKTAGSALKELIDSETKSRIHLLAQSKPEWAILYYDYFNIEDLEIFYKHQMKMFDKTPFIDDTVNQLFSLFDFSFYSATNKAGMLSPVLGGERTSILRKELASEVMEYFFKNEIMVSTKNIFAPSMYLDIYRVFQMGRETSKPNKMEIFGLLIWIDQHKWASRFKNIYRAVKLHKIREFAISRFRVLKESKNVSEADLRYLGRLFDDLGITNEFMN